MFLDKFYIYSEFPGIATDPARAERGPGTQLYNTVSTQKKSFSLHFLTPVDGSTTLLLRYGKAKIRLTTVAVKRYLSRSLASL